MKCLTGFGSEQMFRFKDGEGQVEGDLALLKSTRQLKYES